MAAEIGLMLRAIDYGISFFSGREAKNQEERDLQREFVAAFREALIQTRGYLADRRDGILKINREREMQLSAAWNKAGLCGRDLEPQGDFYEVYFKKSDFWSDPRGWDLSENKELDISIMEAEAEANTYLSSKK